VKSKKLFGTDGIRGLANQYPMTGEVAMQVGRAVAHLLQENPALTGKTSLPVGFKPLDSNRSIRRAKIIVGKDTRLSGYMIEQALASGICSMGADVILIGPLPTPGVAFITQSMRADAGIMISASHNPYYDNGLKIFGADGFKLSDEHEAVIESYIHDSSLVQTRPTDDMIGKAFRIDNVHERYLVFLKSLFPKDLDLIGLRIVIDCANGAGYKVAPMVFEELGAEVIRQGVSPNGVNINLQCGALHPDALATVTRQVRADIGVALDGDGDRCVLTDEKGEIVEGDQIIGLCALQMLEQGELKSKTVVTTPMSNIGLELSLKEKGISMIRVPVGDRHVVEGLKKGNHQLGGESSGHVIFLDHATTGDGIVAALKVLEIMRRTKKPLSELKKMIRMFPQVRIDIPVKQKQPLESLPKVMEAIRDVEQKLKQEGRVFVRYSGTENCARVMVEGQELAQVTHYAETIAQALKESL
jgi:phosphoglucosamine mutase